LVLSGAAVLEPFELEVRALLELDVPVFEPSVPIVLGAASTSRTSRFDADVSVPARLGAAGSAGRMVTSGCKVPALRRLASAAAAVRAGAFSADAGVIEGSRVVEAS
jgi:hypothetical protein